MAVPALSIGFKDMASTPIWRARVRGAGCKSLTISPTGIDSRCRSLRHRDCMIQALQHAGASQVKTLISADPFTEVAQPGTVSINIAAVATDCVERLREKAPGAGDPLRASTGTLPVGYPRVHGVGTHHGRAHVGAGCADPATGGLDRREERRDSALWRVHNAGCRTGTAQASGPQHARLEDGGTRDRSG